MKDQEQVRRDIALLRRGSVGATEAREIADRFEAELEQVERENWLLREQLGSPDDPESWLSLKARAEQAERNLHRSRQSWARIAGASEDQLDAAEARLAALVEAYKTLHEQTCDDYWADDECACGGRQLIAVSEQAQEQRCGYQGFGSGDHPTGPGCTRPKGHDGKCAA